MSDTPQNQVPAVAPPAKPDDAVAKAIKDALLDVTQKKVGDTPQEAFDLANKKYVDNQAATQNIGVAAYAFNKAPSTQTIAHGLGKTPSFLRINAVFSYVTGPIVCASVGAYNGTTTGSVSWTDGGSSQSDSTHIIYLTDSSGAGQQATVTWDATNFYLAWTTVNNQVNNQSIQILWEIN